MPVAAQDTLRHCLAAPVPDCLDVIQDRLVAIETGELPAERLPSAQLQRLTTLVYAGRLDAAEAVLWEQLADTAPSDIVDQAITEIIAASARHSAAPRRDLLARLSSPEHFARARAQYIANLARFSTLTVALEELAATDDFDEPLAYIGVLHLATALLDDGRLQDAIDLADENLSGDEGSHGALLNSLVIHLLDAGRIEDGDEMLPHFRAGDWRPIATGRVAAAMAQNGQMAEAEALFDAARADMATLVEPHRRSYVFAEFAEAAWAARRLDLAVAAARDVGTFPADHANALQTIIVVVAGSAPASDWRPLADRAMAELESMRGADADALTTRDDGWSRLASAVAMAGDADLAVTLADRISDESWRMHDVGTIVAGLIGAGRLQEAFDILPRQTDGNEQTQGYILLSREAKAAGEDALAERAAALAMGLIEGPCWVPVTDATVRLFAELEAGNGEYDRAETRLRFVASPEDAVMGRIANMGFAATNGTEDQFATYFEIARTAADAVEDADLRLALLRNLSVSLIQAGRPEIALGLADLIEDPARRDLFLQDAAISMTGFSDFTHTMDAVSRISDDATRARYEHLLLLAALRAAVAP